MLTIRMKKLPKRAEAIISEVLEYDDIYSNKNSKFQIKKPTISHNYTAEYRIITNEKEPRIFEIFQRAVNEGGKLKYDLSITIDGKTGALKDLEKLIDE